MVSGDETQRNYRRANMVYRQERKLLARRRMYGQSTGSTVVRVVMAVVVLVQTEGVLVSV